MSSHLSFTSYVFDFKFERWLLYSKTEEIYSQLPRYQITHLVSILLLQYLFTIFHSPAFFFFFFFCILYFLYWVKLFDDKNKIKIKIEIEILLIVYAIFFFFFVIFLSRALINAFQIVQLIRRYIIVYWRVDDWLLGTVTDSKLNLIFNWLIV